MQRNEQPTTNEKAMTDYRATRYQINTWGSHPGAGNDDWWTSVNAGDTIEEARAFFSTYRGRAFDSHLELVEIVGDGVMERIAIRNNPAFVECDEGDDGDGGEWAMLQGMAFGCDAYNDARGY